MRFLDLLISLTELDELAEELKPADVDDEDPLSPAPSFIPTGSPLLVNAPLLVGDIWCLMLMPLALSRRDGLAEDSPRLMRSTAAPPEDLVGDPRASLSDTFGEEIDIELAPVIVLRDPGEDVYVVLVPEIPKFRLRFFELPSPRSRE
eukprot:g15414.t1